VAYDERSQALATSNGSLPIVRDLTEVASRSSREVMRSSVHIMTMVNLPFVNLLHISGSWAGLSHNL
jgi:hypothetical protein